MIVGGYALDLYCENENDSKYTHQYNEFPHRYAYELGSTCRRMARKDGWLLSRNRAICPKCRKNKKEKS